MIDWSDDAFFPHGDAAVPRTAGLSARQMGDYPAAPRELVRPLLRAAPRELAPLLAWLAGMSIDLLRPAVAEEARRFLEDPSPKGLYRFAALTPPGVAHEHRAASAVWHAAADVLWPSPPADCPEAEVHLEQAWSHAVAAAAEAAVLVAERDSAALPYRLRPQRWRICEAVAKAADAATLAAARAVLAGASLGQQGWPTFGWPFARGNP